MISNTSNALTSTLFFHSTFYWIIMCMFPIVFSCLTIFVISLPKCYSLGLSDTLEKLASKPIYSISTTINGLVSRIYVPSFTELAAKYGHNAEVYEVTTEDDYKITLFRLPGEKNTYPVLLCHGLGDSADTFVLRGNISLAITLANAKYDVWLINNRGNRYSRKHVYLSPEDPVYWNFTFHEMGLYDLSATIDLILNKTGANKLNAFGHSEGNTIFYTLLSTRKEYNSKINVMTALAPICYLQNLQPPTGTLIRFSPILHRLCQELGITNVFGDDSLPTVLFRTLSQIPVIGYAINAGLLFSICGYDVEELEPEFLSVVGLHFPTWISLKNLIHFAQVGVRKTFAQFDYGTDGNELTYGSATPPVYDLSQVKAKIVLLAARNDKFATLENVAMLDKQLPNVVQYVVIPREKMNHLDYVWGRTMPNYLYKYIFEVLERSTIQIKLL